MEIKKLVSDCVEAILNGTFLTLHGKSFPAGFPRGELMCEQFDGSKVKSFDPVKILVWIQKSNNK